MKKSLKYKQWSFVQMIDQQTSTANVDGDAQGTGWTQGDKASQDNSIIIDKPKANEARKVYRRARNIHGISWK